ncbi:MAG: hypothetical protein VZQ47_07990 [Treponema sp.]|nr:hypothetical protein [Treponema sp.]MEE3435482.1 hypothetical protein [Treponema sp.]
MAGNKTNSNSITAILVNKLNYRKSGFRGAILKSWGLSDDIEFKDGTHSSINFPEMEGKQVDIVGMVGSDYKVLIEVKANLNEPLQDSQKEYGQYQNTAKKHHLDLKFIVPNVYNHDYELPKESKNVKIISWTEIYEIAKENDNTGFTEDIEYFVETDFHKNTLNLVLRKGEVAMFLSPAVIGNVISLDSKIEQLMSNFVSQNNQLINFSGNKKGLGWDYNICNLGKSKKIWIGLYELKEVPNCSFFMYMYQKDGVNIKKNESYQENVHFFKYSDNTEICIPILDENNGIPEFIFSETADDQQQKFNALMEMNIKKFFEIVE